MLKKSVRDSARFAVREVLSLWNMANIPTTIERNAVEKLKQLFDKWIKLKKSSRRVSITQTANEAAFQADTDKPFDIAHADAMTLIKIPEDRLLTDQCTDRKDYIAGK